ncbi:hypothetical protein HYH02_001005 [Chlamydomonas schloesseri]|uniref:Uncharacterized protein n=1 Tax=Chlamydomonas schloesseri TaxID=2026947 RepID=A0A835WTJ7_9CHLO|nr:hypothetical protein HYH02_001005 [Chlamydomonas schloesseri]|eukprot:KAG2453958.1 hypothetical protein HYH02_001005 [Chlamydomonas schloesseri]
MSSGSIESQNDGNGSNTGEPLQTAGEADNNTVTASATPRPKKKAMKCMTEKDCPVCCMVGGRCAWHRGLRYRKRRYINVELA